MYFSIKTAPSPKAEVASLMARSICFLTSFLCSTMRIPFPPPPAAAFIKTGNPIFSAIARASFGSFMALSTPGTIGMS